MRKFLLILFISIILPLSIFAKPVSSAQNQTQLTISQQPSEADRMFTIYQVTNDSINRMIGMIAWISAIFGIFITVVVAFFVIKQIFTDKEIRDYKESIKKNTIIIENETKKKLKEWNEISKKMTERDKVIEEKTREIEKKGKDAISSTEIQTLKKEMEELKDEIIFQKGRISTSVSGIASSTVIRAPSDWLSTGVIKSSDYLRVGDYGSLRCPKCFRINNPGSKFCSDCGESLDNII